MNQPEVDIEQAVKQAETEAGAQAAGPKIVVIGGEEYVVCPKCNETGQEVKILKPGCGRRRAVRKVRPCRFCGGQGRIPQVFFPKPAAAKPGERFF